MEAASIGQSRGSGREREQKAWREMKEEEYTEAPKKQTKEGSRE
jgi:hypothetical protein